jgi:type II secretory pathway pseudopilin PulG
MHRRAGFTVVELTVTMMVAGLLLGLLVRTLGNVRQRVAADQAAEVFEALLARTRAHAIEQGTIMRLVLDTSADTASIVRSGVAVETIRFAADLAVDVESDATNQLVVCMTARGYGDPDCASFSGKASLTFMAGADTVARGLLPLGQVVR